MCCIRVQAELSCCLQTEQVRTRGSVLLVLVSASSFSPWLSPWLSTSLPSSSSCGWPDPVTLGEPTLLWAERSQSARLREGGRVTYLQLFMFLAVVLHVWPIGHLWALLTTAVGGFVLDVGHQLLQGELCLAVPAGEEVSAGEVSPPASWWETIISGLKPTNEILRSAPSRCTNTLRGGNFLWPRSSDRKTLINSDWNVFSEEKLSHFPI